MSYIANNIDIHISFYEYVENKYTNLYFQYRGFYLVNPHACINKDAIATIIELSQAKNIADIIKFCKSY